MIPCRNNLLANRFATKVFLLSAMVLLSGCDREQTISGVIITNDLFGNPIGKTADSVASWADQKNRGNRPVISVRSKSKNVCWFALPFEFRQTIGWDFENSEQAHVRDAILEAETRGFTPETCAALSGREVPRPTKNVGEQIEREGPVQFADAGPTKPFFTSTLSAQRGMARVVDGDTLIVSGERIRLHGIDAPESTQTCYEKGRYWNCGIAAAKVLTILINQRPVECEPKDRDQYGRIVAVCRAEGEDLNAALVAEGMALAYRRYSTDYVVQEGQAKAAKRGMWAGQFVVPWEWRRGKRLSVATPPPAAANDNDASGCLIKGNISRNGRIYHVPGSAYYSRTKINEAKGERWFCNEAEARAAGWRRSRR